MRAPCRSGCCPDIQAKVRLSALLCISRKGEGSGAGGWALTDTAAVGVLVGVEACLGIGALVVQNDGVHAGRDEGCDGRLACTEVEPIQEL